MQAETKLKHAETFGDEFSVSIESDPYVCMSVWIGRNSVPSHHVYWRLVDDLSVVEIGIEESTGRMVSIKVVLYRKPLSPIDPELNECNLTKGVPGFCLDLWTLPTDVYDYGGYVCTIPGSSHLELGEGKLRIRLFPDEGTYGVRTLDQVTCEFNRQRELCAILINGLDEKTMQNLRKLSEKHQ